VRVHLGDFVLQLADRWAQYTNAPRHPASVAFYDRAGPHELVLNGERVLGHGRTREEVVDTYARGKILGTRRQSLSMGAGEIDDDVVVGPVRSETSGPFVGARQWAHVGESSVVVAVLAADFAPDTFSCLAITVFCNVPADLDLAIERLLSEVIAGVSVDVAPEGGGALLVVDD
jgi:hypothetical protein